MARSREGFLTSRSSQTIEPPVGCTSPAIKRNRVVFPQPDGPMTDRNSPALTCKLMPVRIWRAPAPSPNCSETSRISMAVIWSLVRQLTRESLRDQASGVNILPEQPELLADGRVGLKVRRLDLDVE